MNIISFLSKIPFFLSKICEKLNLEKYSKTFPDYVQAKNYCDNINSEKNPLFAYIILESLLLYVSLITIFSN